jgi:hypothetical protein
MNMGSDAAMTTSHRGARRRRGALEGMEASARVVVTGFLSLVVIR